jgi:hypothetical protein
MEGGKRRKTREKTRKFRNFLRCHACLRGVNKVVPIYLLYRLAKVIVTLDVQ